MAIFFKRYHAFVAKVCLKSHVLAQILAQNAEIVLKFYDYLRGNQFILVKKKSSLIYGSFRKEGEHIPVLSQT